jgi:hypothetical protein
MLQRPEVRENPQHKIDSIHAQIAEANQLLREKEIDFIENSYNELYKITSTCLENEKKIIHLKPTVIFIERRKAIFNRDSLTRKHIIKAKEFHPK